MQKQVAIMESLFILFVSCNECKEGSVCLCKKNLPFLIKNKRIKWQYTHENDSPLGLKEAKNCSIQQQMIYLESRQKKGRN